MMFCALVFTFGLIATISIIFFRVFFSHWLKLRSRSSDIIVYKNVKEYNNENESIIPLDNTE